jgi:peptidoglycan-N-acetylmuramic acid deacetylase
MNKSKKKKLKRNNLLLGIIIVFLIGITGYIIKAQLYNPGPSTVVDIQQEQISEDPINTGPGAFTAEQNGQVPAPGGSSGQDSPVFNGDASNDRHGWGFKRNDNHQQPEMPASLNSMLSRNGAYWIGSPAGKVVYLTFDEGYENGYTASILDSLKANNVKAAFFVTGHYLDTQPELVRRMVDEGHIVGNHTDTHPSLPDISDGQIKKEIQVVEQKYEKITGRSDLKYLRPPKGEFSERTLALTRELGYHNILWSMAAVDWVPMPGGAQEAYDAVIDNTHNGALILMHAVSKDNAEAMDRILKGIKAQGYTFGTLDDLVQ